MSTAFSKDWITSPSDSPEDQRVVAERLQAFVEGDVDRAAATALVSAPEAALEALVMFLQERSDGTRLALLRDASLPKAARKAVGRAIQTLKARGIPCDAPDGRAGGIRYAVEVQQSFLGLPMPNGIRLCILSDMVQGEPKTALFVLHDLDGLIEVAGIDPTRSRIKKMIDHLTQTSNSDGMMMVFTEAPNTLLRERIQQAIGLSRAGGKPVPEEANRFELLIGPAIRTSTVHPAHALLSGTDPAMAQEGPGLLGHSHSGGGYHVGICDAAPPHHEGWVDAQRIRIVDAVKASEHLEDETEKAAAISREFELIVDETFDSERRRRDADRLLDCAFVLVSTRMQAPAQIAYATAQALLDDARTAAGIPWARHAVQSWIRPESRVHDHG